jgi:acyl-CoA synthetase (AMP-forming)/AMP-acid ligase II
MAFRLLEQLWTHAERGGERVAVRCLRRAGADPESGAISYASLAGLTRNVARELAGRLPSGATVILCSGNKIGFLPAFLGILEAKMTALPLASDLAGPEMLAAARRSGAAGMIVLGARLSLAGEFDCQTTLADISDGHAGATLWTEPHWPVRRDLGTSMLLLSSGTMGLPKIVRREAAALDAVAENMVRAVGFTPDDRVLAAVPLCHSYGVEHGLLAPVWAGSGVHLCDGFDPALCLSELAGGATIFPGVPFMYEMLCGLAGDPREAWRFPKLRRAYSAGGPLPLSIYQAFRAKFGVDVAQLYGASEVGSVAFNDPAIESFDPASVGRAMDGVDIRILDPADPKLAQPLPTGEAGHVAIGAPSRMSGYLDGEPAPFLDGYFLTGDLGRLDASGALTITGRIKLLIDIGGRKVNPLEVEQVIESHPAVGACIVVPMRVSQTLFRLKAIVTPAQAGVVVNVGELREFARRQLSAYKVPRAFELRESLPRSATGKVLRHLVEAG